MPSIAHSSISRGAAARRIMPRCFTSFATMRRLFGSSATDSRLPLQGQIAWVVGGAGVVGSGIARGLLNAGAAVIVNSRHPDRLKALSEELGHPTQLVTLNSSMMPGTVEETVAMAMEITGNRLDHVIAHSAVRWWASDAGDETSTLSFRGSLLHVPPAEYGSMSSHLGSLHYAAAHHLTPLLRPGGSFTFVTSSADAAWGPRSALAQINAHGVMGLAAAMRSEAIDGDWKFHVGELRLGRDMRVNRPKAERESEPRERPLSHDIGEVVTGFVSEAKGGLLSVPDAEAFERLKQRYVL